MRIKIIEKGKEIEKEKKRQEIYLRETRKQRERLYNNKGLYTENLTWNARESEMDDNSNEKVREKETWKIWL